MGHSFMQDEQALPRKVLCSANYNPSNEEMAMSASGISDLDQLEQQVYESTWNDGLIDLCTGVALLIIGIIWVTGQSVYGTFVAPLMIPVWVAARKRISEPRMGVVRFSADRVGKEKTHFLGLFIFGVLTLVLALAWYFLGSRDESIAVLQQLNIVAGLPAALLLVPAVFVAFSLELPRFFAYGAALLFSAIPVVILDLHPGWAFIPSGILCLAMGICLLARFVVKFPKRG
jgi:hypothetical protein